jgi:integrase
LKGYDIPFIEIDVPLLQKFKSYLKSTRSISERTIINHLIVIRSIFNQAIKGSHVNPKYYPFGRNKIVIKFPDSLKIGFTPDDVMTLEKMDLSQNELQDHARNLWLFSFYFAGMRASDVFRLKWSDFQNNRLYYSMGKNDKGGSLKVPEKALGILEKYKLIKDKTGLVFPELRGLEDINDRFILERTIKVKLKRVNDALELVRKEAKLTSKLSMHISRHTFGNISGEKIPLQMLQKLYRHTSITTTIGYQSNFIHKDADEALDAVITF